VTADQLNKMQQDSIKRHAAPVHIIEQVEEKPETFSQIIEKTFDVCDGALKPKKKSRKQRIIMPDLMAAQIILPCQFDKKEDIPLIQKQPMSESIFDKPYTSKPVQQKKIIFKSPAIIPDLPKEKWERPKAVYDNAKSHYGIYDELKEHWK
jgi:hypothetical protein